MRHFARHYVEMVIVMFAGMAVLGLPAGWAMTAMGTSWGELQSDAPAAMFGAMAVTMVAWMVAWMRFRGHGRRANGELSLSMVLPMLGAMLLRASEYTSDAHAHAQVTT